MITDNPMYHPIYEMHSIGHDGSRSFEMAFDRMGEAVETVMEYNDFAEQREYELEIIELYD